MRLLPLHLACLSTFLMMPEGDGGLSGGGGGGSSDAGTSAPAPGGALDQGGDDGMAEDIAKALDSMDNRGTDQGKPADGAQDTQADTGPDTQAGAQDTQQQQQQQQDQGQDTQTSTPADDAPTAPAHWSQADKDAFNRQTPEARKWLLGRYKAMEGDYTRRAQSVAEAQRWKGEIDEIFKPFQRDLELSGKTPVSAVKELVAAHKYLLEDPENAWLWLADRYKIDVNKALEGDKNKTPEQRIADMEKRIASRVDARLKEALTPYEQQQLSQSINRVEQFAAEKDSQGNLLRPYFDEVGKDIVRLLRAASQGGEPITLQEAYEQAIYANANVRKKVLAAEQAKQTEAASRQRREKANSARQASFDVRGEGAASPGVARSDHDDIAADLEKALEAQDSQRRI